MKPKSISFTLAILFSPLCILSPVHAAEVPVPIRSASEMAPPSTAHELCELLLSLEAAHSGTGDRSPRDLFSTLDLILANYSTGTISRDWKYNGVESLSRAREIAASRRRHDKTAGKSGSDGFPFIVLLEDAARVREDYAVADFFSNLQTLNNEISGQLFFLESAMKQGLDHTSYFTQIFRSGDHYDFDFGLAEVRRSWNRMSSGTQTLTLRWLGRVFSHGAKNMTTTKLDFTDNVISKVSQYQTLPDLSETLEDYLTRHQGEAKTSVLTDQYYEQLAGKLLRLFGVDVHEPRDYPELPAPSANRSRLPEPLRRLLFWRS